MTLGEFKELTKHCSDDMQIMYTDGEIGFEIFPKVIKIVTSDTLHENVIELT